MPLQLSIDAKWRLASGSNGRRLLPLRCPRNVIRPLRPSSSLLHLRPVWGPWHQLVLPPSRLQLQRELKWGLIGSEWDWTLIQEDPWLLKFSKYRPKPGPKEELAVFWIKKKRRDRDWKNWLSSQQLLLRPLSSQHHHLQSRRPAVRFKWRPVTRLWETSLR